MRRIRWRSLPLWVIFFVFACSTGALLGAQGSDPATWPIVYQDDFEDPESGWDVGGTEYASRIYVNGNYEIQVKDEWLFIWSRIPSILNTNPKVEIYALNGRKQPSLIARSHRIYVDFTAEMEVQVVGGAGESGFLFRYQDADNFYCFTIRTDGHYRLRVQKKGRWETLVDWMPCRLLSAQAPNVLRIVAQGARFSFFLNGECLVELTDASFQAGEIALCAGTLDEPGFLVRFDRLVIREDAEVRGLADRADAFYAQGKAQYREGEYRSACESLKKACKLFAKLDWQEKRALTAFYLADSLCSLNNYQGAVNYYRKASGIFLAMGDRWMAPLSLSHLGDCFQMLGDYRSAIEQYENAISLYRDISAYWEMAANLNYLSICYCLLGDYRKAIRLCEDALVTFQGIQDDDALWGMAATLNYLGVYYWLLGNYSTAINSCMKAVSVFQELDDSWGIATSLLNLGHCYRSLGEYNRAIEYYQQSLKIKKAIDEYHGQAMLLGDLGICYYRISDYQNAVKALEQSLSLFHELGDKWGEVNALNDLGECYYTFAQYEIASEYYKESLALADAVSSPTLEAMTLGGLANCYYAVADYQNAIHRYEEGLSVVGRIVIPEGDTAGDPETLWRLGCGLGSAYKAVGDLERAINVWGEVITLIEGMRARLGFTRFKLTFMQKRFIVYEDLISTLLGIGRAEEAVFYAERAKAKTLVDMMETAMTLRAEVLPSDVQTASQLVRDLGGLQEAAAEPFPALGQPSTTRSGVARAIQRTQEEYQTILNELEQEHPELGETLSVNPERLRKHFEHVQRNLGEETVALEYFVTDKETIVWVIAQEGIQTASTIAITRDDLTEQVRAFRKEIEDPPVLEQAAVSYLSALEKGRDLYELLIAPVEESLKGVAHLVIVPSDVLFYLPFEALVNCPECEKRDLYGGKFLIENYSISYAPSMSSLYWPFQHHGNGTYESILAVGNPTTDLRPLPFAEKEVKAAAALFHQATVLIGNKATEAAIKANLQTAHYDVVHLSTHGLFDTTMPLLSELAFCEGEDEDGSLYAGEILGLSLTSSLVVLSACQTALPPELTQETEGLVMGDELQGLSQALFVAGAPSAILTLWNVNDESTSQLMQMMYRGLQSEAKRGEALRQAQLSLLHDPTYRHPYFWAPFVLYGVWG